MLEGKREQDEPRAGADTRERGETATVAPQPCIERFAIIPKGFYVFHGLAYAPALNFLIAWFSFLKFSATVIGLLASINPFVGAVSAPVLTMIADKTRRHDFVWTFSAVFSCIAITSSLYLPPTIAVMAITFSLFSAARSASSPLLDARVIMHVGRENYGRQRLWLSISVGTFAFIAGMTSDYLGIRSIFVFNIVGSVLLVGLIWTDMFITNRRTASGSPPQHLGEAETEPQQPKLRFFSALRILIMRYEVFVVLLRAFLTGLLQAQLSFLFLFLEKEFDVKKQLFGIYGLVVVFSVVSEIPLFFFGKQLVGFIGDDATIAISQVCYIVRAISYTFIPRKIPWLVLPVELLHGPFFTFFLISSITKVSRLAPVGLESTAQGLLSAMYSGFGFGTGNLIGGFLFQSIGAVKLFYYSAGAMGVVFILSATNALVLWAIARRRSSVQPIELRAFRDEPDNEEEGKSAV